MEGTHPKSTIRGAHHLAFRCRDAEQTRWFYEDVLGLPMAAALALTETPIGEPRPYLHIFFEMADGSFLAFFDDPDFAKGNAFGRQDPFDAHLALQVDDEAEMMAMRARVLEAGMFCSDVVDHGFIRSVYFHDPNGMLLEGDVQDGNTRRDDAIRACRCAASASRVDDADARTERGDLRRQKARLARKEAFVTAEPRCKYERKPILVAFREEAQFKDTYAGALDSVALPAHLLRPIDRPSKTVVVFMHPTASGAYLPLVNGLTKAGVHCVWCDSRYRVDSSLIMEKVAIDLGQCIKTLKERFDYETVVLGGWSGGGSLSLFYQAESESPTVTETPAGDPPDLTRAQLIAPDGIMLIAAHLARHQTLTQFLDPSISDEANPEARDPALDIYNPANPNQPPYTSEFLTRYAEEQIARNRRITRWVRDKLAAFRAAGQATKEHGFVVHGTLADPRWLDPTIDPNDREAGGCFLGDPKVVNDSPIGLARFSSLRSWLSQWSYDDANADGERCAARIKVPALVVGNTADDAITPSHTHRLFEAVGHDDKELHWIEGANHYYFGQPGKTAEAVRLCVDWMRRKALLA